MEGTSGKRESSEFGVDEADRNGAVRRIPAPAEALEVRWFVPGAPPPRLWRPERRPQDRVDAYHDQSLRDSFSLKRRGELGPWERKRRVERAHVALLGDITVAEMWTKEPPFWTDPPGGTWTSVRKRIWRRPGVEVVDLRLEAERWWSVAVKLRSSSPAFGAWESLVGLAASSGFSGSYPAWLIARPVAGRRAKARRPNVACRTATVGKSQG